MKILIISDTQWSNDNSFGNTFTNIFGGISDIEIANIYCHSGYPDTDIVKSAFQITEKSLLLNLKNKNNPSGKKILKKDITENISDKNNEKVISFAKKKRWQIMFWARDFIWNIGRWKSQELKDFIDDFNPDILYIPIYYSNYLCKLDLFIKDYLNIPMVGHITDDIYTLKQYKLSPLYWIDKFIIRSKVKKTISKCEYIDTFTDMQKNEYEKIFNKQFHIIYKSIDSESFTAIKAEHNNPLKLAFTGNISSDRWKSLAMIGRALEKINEGEVKAQLYIYTATPLTKKMEKSLTIENSIMMMGSVPPSEIQKIQEDADILVHVESFNLKGKLEVRLSFSTKIVDYLSRGRCILALGPPDVASIDYLVKNDAAIVATREEEIYLKLLEIISNKSILDEYSQKAYSCGKKNHNKKVMQKKFYDELKAVSRENKSSKKI